MKDILIVDDSPDIRQMLQYLLEIEGFNVRVCENGQQAFSELDRNVPDLILLDLTMPIMDGREFIKKRQALNQHTEVPFMVFTAKTEDFSDLHAVDVIPKPFKVDLLLGKLHHFFDEMTKH